MMFHSDTISRICQALTEDDRRKAASIAHLEIPFKPIVVPKRSYGDTEALRVFIRDGFIDRYTGERLVFPGTLRLLSILLPEKIPYHPNWKTTKCHLLFWYLSPTVDHLVPITRGGADTEENWVCTSMLRNAAKAHWTLEELGWQLLPGGCYEDWDGMLGWYRAYISTHQEMLLHDFIRRWYRAAVRVLGTG